MEPMQVAVRVRPMASHELASGCRSCVERINKEPQLIVGNNQNFSFNYVFDDADGQREIYDTCCRSLICKLFEGYNVTILAYGQTGTGKTYTMGTNYSGTGSMGIIPRAILEIFEKIKDSPNKCEVSVSFLELYNDTLYDLLTCKDRDFSVVELRETGTSLVIPGLTQKTVGSAERAMEVLNEGSLLRVTGATAMNATSSRSHAVFTVNIKITPTDEPKNSVLSKFHLVDLAGSERAKKTGTVGDRFKEGVNINKGLLVLGNVISQLGGGNASYINYRDSKLTRLLQDSLGGNSYTLMIACVSPADSNQEETLCTLRYADRVKKIKNKPIINVDPQMALINQLKREVETLRLQMISGNDGSCPPSHAMLEEKLRAEMKKNSELSSALKSALHQKPAIYERSLMIENTNEKIRERLVEVTDILKKATKDPVATSFEKLLEMIESLQVELVKTDKNIIDHSKREQEEDDVCLSGNNELDPPDDVKNQYVLFQAKTNREIEMISKDLILKQDLYDQLQKNNELAQSNNNMGQSYDDLCKLVEKLKAEKQALLLSKSKAVSKNRFGGNSANSGTPDNIQQRLQQLETELQKKLADQQKRLKIQAKAEEKVQSLKKEIQAMKAMKVQLIHQMRAESERFRNWQNEKTREVCKLRNINAKQTNQISKMEKEFSLRQAVLRRKLEAAAAAKKRMEQAVDRRNISSLKRAKDFEPDKLDKLEDYIKAEIEFHESISYAKKSLQTLLDDRSTTMKEIQSLKDSMYNYDRSLTAECRESYENRIKILQQETELQSTQISDLQKKIIDSRQDERKKQRWDGIKSMAEAKHALCFLFTTVTKSYKEVMNLNDTNKDLKTELDEKLKELDELQSKLSSSEMKNKKKCDEIVRDYEEKIYELLLQKSNNSLDENKVHLPLQEVTQNISHNASKRSLLSVSNKMTYNPCEAEYIKFLNSGCQYMENEEGGQDENSPPKEKKARQDDDLNETFIKSSPQDESQSALNETYVKSSSQTQDLDYSKFEIPKRKRRFFEDS